MSPLSQGLRDVAEFLAPGVTVVASTMTIRAESGDLAFRWSELLVAAAAAVVTSAAVHTKCRHAAEHSIQEALDGAESGDQSSRR